MSHDRFFFFFSNERHISCYETKTKDRSKLRFSGHDFTVACAKLASRFTWSRKAREYVTVVAKAAPRNISLRK